MEGNNGETLLDAEDKGQTQSQELPGKTRGSTWQADNTVIAQSQPNSEIKQSVKYCENLCTKLSCFRNHNLK